MAAGDPERRPGHDEPRPGDLAGRDRVAQRDVREAAAPTLRTVVNPASSVRFALATPSIASRGTEKPSDR